MRYCVEDSNIKINDFIDAHVFDNESTSIGIRCHPKESVRQYVNQSPPGRKSWLPRSMNRANRLIFFEPET